MPETENETGTPASSEPSAFFTVTVAATAAASGVSSASIALVVFVAFATLAVVLPPVMVIVPTVTVPYVIVNAVAVIAPPTNTTESVVPVVLYQLLNY